MPESSYPISKTKFRVEIQGLEELGGWKKVSGLKFGVQTTPVYDQHTDRPQHLAGKPMAGPIRLERHFDGNKGLPEWATKQATDPRDGSIIFLDITGEEKFRFNWSEGWVSQYALDGFDADPESDGPMSEAVVINVTNIFLG